MERRAALDRRLAARHGVRPPRIDSFEGLVVGQPDPDDPSAGTEALEWVRGKEIAASAAYADASALVKLIFPESESQALDAALKAEDRVLASEIVAVELSCAVHGRG